MDAQPDNETPTPSQMKVAICEYMIEVNKGFVAESGHPIIPPTAINWLGDGMVEAILACTSTPSED